MASTTTTPRPPDGSPLLAALGSPLLSRTRRNSVNSAVSSTIDREQLAQTLDKIHSSASRSDALTTFNDFAPPPVSVQASESRGSAGDFVHQGLSGLYSRIREAVGGGSSSRAAPKDEDVDPLEISPRGNLAPASLTSPRAEVSGAESFVPSEPRSPHPQHSRPSSISLMSGPRALAPSRQSLPTNATSTVTAGPTITTPNMTGNHDSILGKDGVIPESRRRSTSRGDFPARLSPIDRQILYDANEGLLPPGSKRGDDSSSIDESIDAPVSPVKLKPALISPLLVPHSPNPSVGSLLPPDEFRRKPTVIDRIARSGSPHRYHGSRDSSIDRLTAEPSPVNTSAHGSVHHESFSQESKPQHHRSGDLRIPGTTTSHRRAFERMSGLEGMKRQVLSKEFWMKDETVKECFLCQVPFNTFRRKHHCRTCGFIFDAKCTTVISGEKFGLTNSIRVCKRCLDVITRRFDASASEDSGDEQAFMPKLFGADESKKTGSSNQPTNPKDQAYSRNSDSPGDTRPVSTPMMAIPAARRVRDSNHSNSAVLEIDAPQLSRPGSSRSLKSLTAGRPHSSAGHKRHHSKHGFLARHKFTKSEDHAPFRKGLHEETANNSKFPAFHDDNIIDPELADYMSDDSSGDEQVSSIFATMASADLQPSGFEADKANLASLMGASRKHRHRGGEKSVSGLSHFGRVGFDDSPGPSSSFVSHRKSTRRRNLSNVSGSILHMGSPRPKSGIFKGPSLSSEMLLSAELSGTQLGRSNSLQKERAPRAELNQSSLLHVDKLLHQLLVDAKVPNPDAWQKVLVPILLQATDDVSPDVANGESMDVRNFVKLKRIPGGKPGDTSYASGVVFTKNLALKSMPRKITNPRILLVSFPIEYQRHQQQQFMSLQPVIEQEKEFLRVVVQRITNLRPQVLLAEKSISGVALQYLSEANIAVAYNVKRSVIAAVARCTETKIIESLDMFEAQAGRCSKFEVRTFVNNDYPNRKKSYIFITGCRPELGCTISLRGANNALLGKIKYITDFMAYVVYNLKLESSLLRDESVEPPDVGETSLSSSYQALNESIKSLSSSGIREGSRIGPPVVVNQASGDSEPPSQTTVNSSSSGEREDASSTPNNSDRNSQEPAAVVSLHQSHAHAGSDSQVPDDVPMPTFYSDMVSKYETKILSASPYVRFTQPYLLMNAREQERRLLYLKRLRDHDTVDEKADAEKADPQKFQLIKPEMVEEIGQKAPRQIMEILHAVHDAEYDKALYNYQTQTRQWETYIQGNLDLFDPYSHQNIVVLYSVICTENKVPCNEPSLVAINFYDEQREDTGMDPDCTLGQYIEFLATSKDDICDSNICNRKMIEHHRTFVHDQSRITVFVERFQSPSPRRPELGDSITMWTYCKICEKDSAETPMSETTYKYSFGKYLELLFWGKGLRMRDIVDCPHDHQSDHVRYFSLHDIRIRIHWDPIDLLEIVVPRARITWKVVKDLKLKNDIFVKMEERWNKFMASIKARIKSIRIDSVLPEKAEACKAELEMLTRRSHEEQAAIIHRLQYIYVNSKYYEVVPFNIIVREMLESATEWDQIFSKFESDFLGDKDIRQLTMIQLKKMFTDNESKESLVSTEGTGSIADSEEPPSQSYSEVDEKSTNLTELPETPGTEINALSTEKPLNEKISLGEDGAAPLRVEKETIERVKPLDLATLPPAAPAPGPVPGPAPVAPDEVLKSPTSPIATPERPPLFPSGFARSPTGSTRSGRSMTERLDSTRREQAHQTSQPAEVDDAQGDPEGSKQGFDRSPGRKVGFGASPPMIRATSHPTSSIPRLQSLSGKPAGLAETNPRPPPSPCTEQPEGSSKVEKKIPDRLGLTVLKNRPKLPSGIPRLVKRKESQVTTLTRHFEQLSREFEQERLRDRKRRAASLRQPRPMLATASNKATVQVYDNVNEAFNESGAANEQALDRDGEQQPLNAGLSHTGMPREGSLNAKVEAQDDAAKAKEYFEKQAPAKAPPRSEEEAQRWKEESGNANASQLSEDEGAASDAEPSVSDEFLPDIKEIADSNAEIPLELPKHQKMSLMKYLTNFWAERSASGWPPLEYPVNATDHIFVDSDIIVREDEPSSVIALALNSDDYKGKLAAIRQEAQETILRDVENAAEGEAKSLPVSEGGEWKGNESELEKSLLRATGTHLKYQFREGAAIMSCKIFYAEQFDALRRKCGVAERIIESLSRCLKWDSKGGKTKSVFLKTLDDRLVLKSLSQIETSAFLRFAPGYFTIMNEALFHDLPSVIAKMLGFFQILIKNPVTGTDIKLDLLVTENLFYDRSPTRIFDLKGSMRNRKIQSTGEQNEVLLDENMVEYIYESPLFAREHSKKLLRASVWNDTLFLARQNVMDYSLMIAVDESRKELVVGIIDCIRTYTWDKKLESWIKDRGLVGGGRNRPTVTSPKEYKSRFREAMARYILQAPNCWHLFNNPQNPLYYGRARFAEEPDVREQ
ncbi:1-phosphatidylinositol 3-phosphate 5-kinase FAB1 [Escovopsis weberi]|uniref:1-phosphatidylinositol-3-phosphate 5-kinase n=1 Tax=Escovopsis weberi TaxID=150374 RepID=A0A0M9VSM3_ESCWE|nr:1-phosphatidylinositol 3-phosphate 5-kinase FAB1 [Escovopsis weberi]